MKTDSIPHHFAPYFEIVRRDTAIAWRCRRCGQVIAANSLGAASHLSKHCAEVLRRDREEAAK